MLAPCSHHACTMLAPCLHHAPGSDGVCGGGGSRRTARRIDPCQDPESRAAPAPIFYFSPDETSKTLNTTGHHREPKRTWCAWRRPLRAARLPVRPVKSICAPAGRAERVLLSSRFPVHVSFPVLGLRAPFGLVVPLSAPTSFGESRTHVRRSSRNVDFP